MSQTRGAAAPTSGQQDHVELNTQALDQAINDVAKNAQAWAATSPVQRAEFLARIISDTYAVSEEWTAAGCYAKGLDPKTTKVAAVMTQNPHTVEPEVKVAEAVLTMMEHGIGYLPVVSSVGKILGIFSVRDALPREIGDAASLAEFNEQVNDALA